MEQKGNQLLIVRVATPKKWRRLVIVSRGWRNLLKVTIEGEELLKGSHLQIDLIQPTMMKGYTI